MILSVDPGKTTSVVLCDDRGKLIDAREFKFDYSYDPVRIPSLHQKDLSFCIDEMGYVERYALLEVPYSISKEGKPYLYIRSKNQMSLLKLYSSIICIHQTLQELDFAVLTIPVSYWLRNNETFESKKQCCMGLIDFEKIKVTKSNDHLLDAVLMSYRFNHNPILKQKVIDFNKVRFDR